MNKVDSALREIRDATRVTDVTDVLGDLTVSQLAEVVDRLRRPDGMVTPFNAGPPACRKTRAGYTAFIQNLVRRGLDSGAIDRAVWSA